MLVALTVAGPRFAHAEIDVSEAAVKEFVSELTRHDEAGDCQFVDDFVDRNIRSDDAAGIAARFVALEDLTRGKTSKPGDKPYCRYHDRRSALQLAIAVYEENAMSKDILSKPYPVEASLEGALGSVWQERLAEAGERAAMQDLVALHLSCFRKDGANWTAFWDWLLSGSTGDVWLNVEYALNSARRSWCMDLPGAASLETACYWNAVERNSVIPTEPLVVSAEMRMLLIPNIMLARGSQITQSAMKFVEKNNITLQDPRADAQFHAQIRDLIAEGCAAALSSSTMEGVNARATRGPSRSLESLIADVQ